MWRAISKRLGVFLLVSALLAVPALATPDAGNASEAWWQLSLERVLDWVRGAVPNPGWHYTASEDSAPTLFPDAPQPLEDSDSDAGSSNDNTYPILDPNG